MSGDSSQPVGSAWHAPVMLVWRTPIVSILLAIVLLADASAQPYGTAAYGLMSSLGGRTHCVFPRTVVQDAAGWRMPDDNDYVAYSLKPELRSALVIRRRGVFGVWAPTTRWLEVRCMPDATLTAADTTAIIDIATADWEQAGVFSASDGLAVRRGGGLARLPVSGGYWHNAGAFLGIGALVVSLGWVGPAFQRATDRSGRRLASGICPRCQYDLRGLPTPRCPECGEEFGA